MWLDALALLVLAIFATIGALRGALAAAMSVLTLGVAYGAAWVAGPKLGPGTARQLDVSEPIGLVIAASAAFVVALAVMGLLARALRRMQKRGADDGRSRRDRVFGAAFGSVRGALVVILLSYLVIWLDALRVTGTAEVLPEVGDSRAVALTEAVVEAGMERAMAGAGAAGRMAARIAARPGATITELQGLIENPRFEALRDDRNFWAYVEAGAVDAALNQRSFLNLTYDDELREQLADLGLIDEEAARDTRAFRAAAKEVLGEVGPRIRALQSDPQFKELMEDPEVMAALREGNSLALVTHPDFRELVSRVAAGS